MKSLITDFFKRSNGLSFRHDTSTIPSYRTMTVNINKFLYHVSKSFLWKSLFYFVNVLTLKIPQLRNFGLYLKRELAVGQEVENTFSSDNIITTRQKRISRRPENPKIILSSEGMNEKICVFAAPKGNMFIPDRCWSIVIGLERYDRIYRNKLDRRH